MEEILAIQKRVMFDESIAHYETHAHQPFASTTFNNSDEIRIVVQHQDLCLLPSKSSLHISGKLSKPNGNRVENTKLVNNAICHLFEEIRYELNAVEIDRCKNVGLTTLMKNYISQSPGQMPVMENAGWLKIAEAGGSLTNADGYFDVSIPLSMILGFAEDHRRIVVNVKHELILTRSNTDTNAVVMENVVGAANFEEHKIALTKIEWIVPYVRPSDQQKIQLLNFIAKDPPISMSFRTWELYEYPLLPASSNHVWAVKTSTQLEKPRYVVVAFQTGRKGNAVRNASCFDHCNIRDVKLFLNSQCYPYGNLNLDIMRNQYALLYEMYEHFQPSYYGKESEPLLNRSDFIDMVPLIVIDCSKQNEFLKSGPVDIRLEFDSEIAFPPQTSAYCLIMHDRIIEYNPISGNVKKLV